MNEELLTHLIERHRDAALNPAQAEQLAALIDADNEDGRWVREHLALIGLTAQALDDVGGEAMATSLGERLRAERSGSRFVRSVQSRSRQPPSARGRGVARGRRQPLAWLMAGAVLAAAAVLVPALRGAPAVPAVASPAVALAELVDAGSGGHLHRDGRDLPASSGLRLALGDELAAGPRPAVWRYVDGTTLALQADGAAVLQAADPAAGPAGQVTGKRIRLDRGTLIAEVAPQPVGRPLIIASAVATCEVVGTRFEFSAKSASATLTVRSGRVRLTSALVGQTIEVAAAQRAEVAAGVPLLAVAIAATATEPAAAVVGRLLDDHEGPLRWAHDGYSGPVAIALAADHGRSGRHSLRLDYKRDTSDRQPFAQVLHPLALTAQDRVLCLWAQAEAAEATARWQCQLRDREGNFWKLGLGEIAAFKPGWNELRLAIGDHPENAYYAPGQEGTEFRREAVTAVAINCYGGDMILFIDDLEALPAAPGQPAIPSTPSPR